MTATPDTEELVAFLETPDTYGLPSGEDVTRIETHASHVFLAGERAYKMKKPVRFTFLDFSTLERRKAACAHEVELNRRTAPEIYLGLVPVTRDGDALALGGGGEAVEWLVEMRRFGSDGLLATLADKGDLKLPLIEQLAADVAAFHARAEVRPGFGGAESFLKIVEGSEEDMKPSLGKVLDAEKARGVTARSKKLMETHAALMDARRDGGQVRHCHGDLHLGNVTVVDGHPVIFDCVEFNDHIARIDVFYDLAFLLMDLAFRAETDERLAGHANRALNVYLDHVTRDDLALDGLALLPLFMATRAVVRAKVTAVQAKDEEAKGKARAYLDFAAKLLEEKEPRLVAVGGLSGTGKSTLAKEVAARLGGAAGALHLRTDVIRKRLFGAGPLDRLPDEAYAPGAGEKVYEEMCRLAREALGGGTSVVMDAVFAREEERRAAADLAAEKGISLEGLWLDAPASVLEARVAEREKRGDDPSDAGVEVLRKQLSYDLGEMTWRSVDASGTPEQALERAMAALGPHQN
ncbi:bifunctional aminoglycoside phosphotransferase/ATP-binding protein [Parvibaculum sp.]|uniref:bifunctional aminoglycoside phosphotransferase/ATP-binding protein n=1 Tax=Parvibaculum sp. TaxID=2024848 RepID=UPI002FDAE2C5